MEDEVTVLGMKKWISRHIVSHFHSDFWWLSLNWKQFCNGFNMSE